MANFLPLALNEIVTGEKLPGPIYVLIDQRYITFRGTGDVIDLAIYERLELKKVTNLFIAESDISKFVEWRTRVEPEQQAPATPEAAKIAAVREDLNRRAMDIFSSSHPDKIVRDSFDTSRKLVAEVMKFPLSVKSLSQLHAYSPGTAGHSVNVSILAVYLAAQMGYTHTMILNNLAMGALLHDIGKTKIRIDEGDSPQAITAKMEEHPTVGARLLESSGVEAPKEVIMIVAQHHECHDGTGYPKKLRGSQMYDLAKIVAIANIFDELVSDGSGSLVERQIKAILQMDQTLYHKFDPEKHDKALKILKLGV